MKCQLWSQDEYGTGSILGTFDEPSEAMKKACELVTEANFGNSLTSSEQLTKIEAYVVEVMDKNGKIDPNFVYASSRPDGKHRAMKTGSTETKVLDSKNSNVRIYIGSKFAKKDGKRVETRHYLKDGKGNHVTSLTHEALKEKTVYFVRRV